MGGSVPTLRQTAPQEVEFGIQFYRNFNYHGLISLILGNGPDQQVFSFDLEHNQEAWLLRRWDDDNQAQFRLEISHDKAVPWVSTGIFDFLNQVLSVPLILAPSELEQAVSSIAPESEPSQPVMPQTLVVSRPILPPPSLCLINTQSG
jgi:hypothetical protein